MAMDREQVIAGLLRQSRDESATPEEREAFAAKAAALMVKWEIQDVDLNKGQGRTRNTADIRGYMVVPQVPALHSREYATLMVGVAKAMGLDGILLQPRAGERWIASIVAYPADIERVRPLIESLSIQALFAVNAWSKTRRGAYANNKERRDARMAFIRGFGDRVAERLREIRDREAAAHAGSALVLYDKSLELKAYVDAMKPRTLNALYNPTHLNNGREAGNRADIGLTGVNNPTRAAIG